RSAPPTSSSVFIVPGLMPGSLARVLDWRSRGSWQRHMADGSSSFVPTGTGQSFAFRSRSAASRHHSPRRSWPNDTLGFLDFGLGGRTRLAWGRLRKLSRVANFLEACFGETPKPTRETRALPGKRSLAPNERGNGCVTFTE